MKQNDPQVRRALSTSNLRAALSGLAGLMLLAAGGCDDPGALPVGAVVVVSDSPDSVPDSTLSIAGRVLDFITAERVPGAFISTFPPTQLLRANAQGEYLLTEGVVPGRLYEIRAEAPGYNPAVMPVQTEPGKALALNMTLIPSDRATPVRIEPPVLVLTSDLHQSDVTLTSDASETLELTFDGPDWLALPTEPLALVGGERRQLTLRLSPQKWAEAVAGLEPGQALQGAVVVRDQFDRVEQLNAISIPARPEQFSLTIQGEPTQTLRVGQTLVIEALARFESRPLRGALVGANIEGEATTAVVGELPAITDEAGRALVQVEAKAAGQAVLSVSLPSYPTLAPATVALRVLPRSPCLPDEAGNNACGLAHLWRCGEDERGEALCADIDECAVDLEGQNACGDAAFWRCANNLGAPPECVDVDECADDNGGCGDPAQARCFNREGQQQQCRLVNGCVVDEAGFNDCGEARRWQCTPDELGEEARCEDIDECAVNNGGCGSATFTRCLNQQGAAPLCEDIDECAVDDQGDNRCGPAAFWRCENRDNAPPVCTDLIECAVDNGGCGSRLLTRCVEIEGGPPFCEDIDECLPDLQGNNACGVALRWRCDNNIGALPDCQDIDECAVNNGSCGSAAFARCLNQQGAAPLCEDIDECDTDSEGNNACGLAQFWRCDNNNGAQPDCQDIDECADDNGGCGDPFEFACLNVVGQAPECLLIDDCTPDSEGNNICGVARRWQCVHPPGFDALCADIDECAPDLDGDNACGQLERFECTNNVGAAPRCADVDECALNNGSCGSATFTRCVNRLGLSPLCVDIDECVVDNGGCGDVRFFDCLNRLGQIPVCSNLDLCQADQQGNNGCGLADQWRCTDTPGQPVCVDIDDCALVNGDNVCGRAIDGLCTNNLGQPALCEPCPPGSFNLNGDRVDNCEYPCTPSGGEQCNDQDDDCDGLIDENFDLRSRNDHCGACGVVCGQRPGSTGSVCVGGSCQLLRCLPGFIDDNGDPLDGCEVELPDDTLFVDDSNEAPGADGSPQNPFGTIQLALIAAEPGQRIFVHPGAYTGSLNIGTSDLTLEGAGADLVTFTNDTPAANTISVTGDRVTITGLTVNGGRVGVFFSTSDGGRAHDITVSSLRAPDASSGNGTAAIGILALNAREIVVTRVRVFDAIGAVPAHNGTAGGAHGVFMDNVQSCVVEANTVEDMRGGTGIAARFDGFGTALAGTGGFAAGLILRNSSGCQVRFNTFRSIQGGTGGAGETFQNRAPPRIGGEGNGINIQGTSANNTLTDNIIVEVRGGIGGSIGTGSTINGATGADGVGIQLVGARATVLARNTLSNLTGGSGGSGGNQGVSGRAFGVNIQGGSDTSLTNLSVFNLRSGITRSAVPLSCVRVSNASAPTLNRITCHGVDPDGIAVGHGLLVESDQRGPLEVRDSIFSSTSDACIQSNAASSVVSVAFVAVSGCGETPLSAAVAITGDVYEDPPGFVNTQLGDLHLLPTSPLIDAGHPNSPFALEPAPNGCAANLGAFANTLQATPAAGDGVPHCAP